jgi:CheY-like chemotaxis protein
MKILLMDDEDPVRVVTTRILEFLGYTVTGVSEGRRAVECFREACEKQEGFDFVILDISVNDGLGGIEALDAMLAFKDGIPAVASSGFSDPGSVLSYRKAGFQWFLPKPVELDEIQAVLLDIQRHLKLPQ